MNAECGEIIGFYICYMLMLRERGGKEEEERNIGYVLFCYFCEETKQRHNANINFWKQAYLQVRNYLFILPMKKAQSRTRWSPLN